MRILADYRKGSILNLMSSIARGFNVKTKYPKLKLVDSKELKKNKNIILIVVDGLGYDYLMKNGIDSVLGKNLKGKITSVFPSATTAAIPVFYTGDSCLKHGMVSWKSFIKEFGEVILPLPYLTRVKPQRNVKEMVAFKKVFNINSLSDKIKIKNKDKVQSYLILGDHVKDSEFSISAGGKAKRIGYSNYRNFFNKLKKIIKTNDGKKYILGYLNEHDKLCHEQGTESRKVLRNFKKLNQELERFLRLIGGANTKIIITADHGSINVPKEKKIHLKDHPKLVETLKTTICGDNRYTFCFVKKDKKKQFEKYVKTNLNKYCDLFKSKDLVKKGFFGLEKPSEKFLERIGDYTIIMKKDYGIYQKIKGEPRKYNLGEHGGLSKEEMFVPLIVIDV